MSETKLRDISSFVRRKMRRLPSQSFVMLLASAVGFATGLACVGLKWSIKWVSDLMSVFISPGANPVLLLLPLAGLVLAALFSRLVVGENLSRSTDKLITFLRKGGSDIKKSHIYGPLAANVFTLGFGGSAGAEGPIAVAGAAIGSNMARYMGLTPQQVRLFIGCGAGAGIAAIFKAPVGGMLFTLEILRLPFTSVTVFALLLACLASALTCYMLTGFTFDVFLAEAFPFPTSAYLGVVGLGIFAGVYSLYYSDIVERVGRLLGRLGGQWTRILVAGAGMGLLLYIFPALYGEGYGVMDKMLNGDWRALWASGPFAQASSDDVWTLAAIVGALLAVKAVAVGWTTYAGVAGDFAPTLFAGSLAGLLFAVMANKLTGSALPAGDFALIGMCAVFAGVIRAPFMAMFLTPEMTGNFTLFLPMVLASGLSYGIVRLVRSENYYHERFRYGGGTKNTG
ncbi:H(+)/Cl(-) exchange transporter ClcA [Muribaculaceae bacterium]|nr:H(+)/Cl(-) exchange transporter ClcA [Muribaculaceae bacterium]